MRYSAALVSSLAAGSALALPQARGGAKGGCSPLELVVARGSMEPQGNGMTGTPLLRAVQQLVPGTTAYAVKYPADMSSTSPGVGVQDVLRYFASKPKDCPTQKYVLSGYSQGGVVMHQAAPKIPKDILVNRVIATATFGDPGQQATKSKAGSSPGGGAPIWPDELNNKTKFNCNKGDPTCTPGGNNIGAHLGYTGGTFVQDSAKWIAQKWQENQKGAAAAAPPALETRGMPPKIGVMFSS